jgi:Co/Zn/Cd efflux system component
LRRTVAIVAAANLAYFFIEFWIAREIGWGSLFADSIDFLEDTAIKLLILLGLGWSAASRARLGRLMAVIICVPGLATAWTAWQKFLAPTAPEPWLLSAGGLGALAVNVGCALLLARYRSASGSLTRAAYLSARNDAFANIAIVGAGLVTQMTMSGWPDLIVGIAIAAMNADAAAEVWRAAADEHSAEP